MSFYLKIKEQNFKVPNNITIGRGEPFTCLNDERSVARAHVQVIFRKGKYYVKDIKSKTGTFVNGKKIKPNKFFEIRQEDSIQIAGIPLEILKECPSGQVYEVKANFYNEKKSLRKSRLISNGLIVFIGGSLLFGTETSIGFKLLFVLPLILCTFIINWFFSTIGWKFMRGILVEKVFFNPDGFTFHYFNGENMTFRHSDIESWSKSGKRLKIKMLGKVYYINVEKEFEPFVKYLETYGEQKEQDSSFNLTQLYLPGVLFFGYVLAGAGETFISKIYPLTIVGLVGAIFYEFKKSGSFKKSHNIKFYAFASLFFAFMYFKMNASLEEKKANLAKLSVCEKDPAQCKNVNFYALESIKINANVINAACDEGNSGACYLKGRIPASSKSQ